MCVWLFPVLFRVRRPWSCASMALMLLEGLETLFELFPLPFFTFFSLLIPKKLSLCWVRLASLVYLGYLWFYWLLGQGWERNPFSAISKRVSSSEFDSSSSSKWGTFLLDFDNFYNYCDSGISGIKGFSFWGFGCSRGYFGLLPSLYINLFMVGSWIK